MAGVARKFGWHFAQLHLATVLIWYFKRIPSRIFFLQFRELKFESLRSMTSKKTLYENASQPSKALGKSGKQSRLVAVQAPAVMSADKATGSAVQISIGRGCLLMGQECPGAERRNTLAGAGGKGSELPTS